MSSVDSNTPDIADLYHLACDIDRARETLTPAQSFTEFQQDETLIAYICNGEALPPTVYSQCSKKPSWPLWANQSFDELWASL